MPIPSGADRKAWAPTPAMVHALIPLRPAFTATTRPTEAEVQSTIDMATDVIDAESPVDFSDELAGKVRFAIALNVASMVEASYFPEQYTGPDAPGQDLYTRYQAELIGLRSLLSSTVSSGGAFTIRPAGDPGLFRPVTPA